MSLSLYYLRRFTQSVSGNIKINKIQERKKKRTVRSFLLILKLVTPTGSVTPRYFCSVLPQNKNKNKKILYKTHRSLNCVVDGWVLITDWALFSVFYTSALHFSILQSFLRIHNTQSIFLSVWFFCCLDWKRKNKKTCFFIYLSI